MVIKLNNEDIKIPEYIVHLAAEEVSYNYFKYNSASELRDDLDITDEDADDDYFKYHNLREIATDYDIWDKVEELFKYEIEDYIIANYSIETLK